eukprot:6476758-Amphidinium_carterae.2
MTAGRGMYLSNVAALLAHIGQSFLPWTWGRNMELVPFQLGDRPHCETASSVEVAHEAHLSPALAKATARKF